MHTLIPLVIMWCRKNELNWSLFSINAVFELEVNSCRKLVRIFACLISGGLIVLHYSHAVAVAIFIVISTWQETATHIRPCVQLKSKKIYFSWKRFYHLSEWSRDYNFHITLVSLLAWWVHVSPPVLVTSLLASLFHSFCHKHFTLPITIEMGKLNKQLLRVPSFSSP